MKIIIDPRLQYAYASYYLLGIETVFGKKSIRYSAEPFEGLDNKYINAYRYGFAFVIKNWGNDYKVFIDSEDVASIFNEGYEWCDIYGKVNPTFEHTQKYIKLLAIGPSFGITLHSIPITIIKCLKHYFQSIGYTNVPLKKYLQDYLYSNIRRRPINVYEKLVKVHPNYIFHSSTLWYNKFAETDTNYWRGEFLRACQQLRIKIEGGLFYIEGKDVLLEMPDYPKYKEIYKDFIYDKRLSMDEYIKKTKESVLVFNTPSVCGCHGWKLAEYLCMGKAIISTKLSREMPEPMVHGENIHFVHTKKELLEAIMLINSKEEYRRHLEKGARRYYEQWLKPDVVIDRLLEHALNIDK